MHGVKNQVERERRIVQVLEEVRLSPAEDYLGKFPHMRSTGHVSAEQLTNYRNLSLAALAVDPKGQLLNPAQDCAGATQTLAGTARRRDAVSG